MENKASRVLIVDDMPINRMIISSLLATNGVLSDQAESGRECLEMCAKKDYDLILLDHRMPEMDGVDTFMQLNDIFSRKGRHIPVVCHTTDEGRKNINLYKAAGFADVLIKPIEPKQLSEVIMTYLPEEDKIMTAEELLPALMEEKETDASAEPVDVREELDKLPLWLKTVPHIDLVAGITNCETAADYVDALYIFHSSIIEKAGEIEYYLQNGDWTMYKLCVHSLKSMARLVGARMLHEKAASLEAAAGDNAFDVIQRDTPKLLTPYLNFIDLLAPLLEDENIKRILSENAASEEKAVSLSSVRENHSRTILFIQANQGIVTKGIENNLRDADFSVISIPDEPDMIITYRFEADIVIYFPNLEDDSSHIGLTMNLLGEICQDDAKILCLIGDVTDLETAMAASGAHRVSRTYPRPVNILHFIRDMDYFATLLEEYHRKKTLFIVDDDPDYLSIITHWLSTDYQVSYFHSGDEIIAGLSTATPDLILMDYDMPKMDGYELMRSLRANPATSEIPIIFLTGKNDRDHVVRILEYKPDGYLLKTSQKDNILDAIDRFFAETMFHKTL